MFEVEVAPAHLESSGETETDENELTGQDYNKENVASRKIAIGPCLVPQQALYRAPAYPRSATEHSQV